MLFDTARLNRGQLVSPLYGVGREGFEEDAAQFSTWDFRSASRSIVLFFVDECAIVTHDPCGLGTCMDDVDELVIHAGSLQCDLSIVGMYVEHATLRSRSR